MPANWSTLNILCGIVLLTALALVCVAGTGVVALIASLINPY